MMDEQIEEMEKDIAVRMAMAKGVAGSMNNGVEGWLSEYLYNAGYRKIPENAVVLTREEYEKQMDELKEELWKSKQDMMVFHSKTVSQAVKDTAKEILDDLRNIFIEQSSYGCDTNQHIGYYDYEIKLGLVVEQIDEYAKEKYGIEYDVEVNG